VERAERARALAALADEQARANQVPEAVATAREAVALARFFDDETEADATLALAAALLAAWELDGAEPTFMEAMERLDRAAQLFERLRSIDFWSALVLMAEANWRADNLDTARALFARVTRELGDERWAREGLDGHADHLRGCAFAGLGFIAIAHGMGDTAIDHFEAALSLFLVGDEDGWPHVERIAEALAFDLGLPVGARLARAAAEKRWGSRPSP
jgi:hypothetical protein